MSINKILTGNFKFLLQLKMGYKVWIQELETYIKLERSDYMTN